MQSNLRTPIMSTKESPIENFENWTAAELGEYLRVHADLGDYYEAVLKHDITGKVAPKLCENDMKEMGITSIGDRKRLQLAIVDLQKAARKQEREKVIWEGHEVLWFSCWDAALGSCCGCCPVDPASYKLTGTHLVIKTEQPFYCGPCRCCFGHEYTVDNVDLTYITDSDIKGNAPPCCQVVLCCGTGRDEILIKTSADGEKLLKLEKGQGDVVSRKIMNQVEEIQRIERD